MEHVQDPRKFYAPDSPVHNNSDSDQQSYKSAEETLEAEDQGDEQVGGNSAGLHVSLHVSSAWSISAVPTIPTPSQQSRSSQSIQGLLVQHTSPRPLAQPSPRPNLWLPNADDSQQGNHSPIIVPPQVPPQQLLGSESSNRRVGGRGQKVRRRSPQRRGVEEKALAVSSLSIRSISLFS